MSIPRGPLARPWAALGVRGKQFVVSLTLIIAAGLTGGLFAERKLESVLVQRIERELDRHTQSARVALAHASVATDLDRLADELGAATAARITIIDASGRVVGDSEVAAASLDAVENHTARPEVESAVRDGHGVARRRSATVGADMLYVTRTCTIAQSTGVVRVALPLTEIDASIFALRVLFFLAGLVGLLVAVVGSAVASDLVSRRLRTLVQRATALRVGGQTSLLERDGNDELDGLSMRFDALAGALEANLAALGRERDRFESLLQAMNEGVLAIDGEGRIVLMNPAAHRLLGVTEALGRALSQVAPFEALQQLAAKAQAGTAGQTELEVRGTNDDERPRRVLVSATPKPTFGGVVLVAHDVTDIRRLETLRKDFVANVSHELRTPVSVILANAETLLSGALQEPQRAQKFVEAMHRNAERLARLISDLLDISRIEAGKQTIARVPIRIRPIAEHVLEAVEPRARDKRIGLHLEIDSEIAIEGDPKALDQVLINLVDNAVKYTPAEGEVSVRAERRDNCVRLVVEDNGLGVDPRHRERLFERFYRVDPGRSRDVGGTGLGLAIVKHLVEAMGGRVGVEDAVPRGTRFFVDLPLPAPIGTDLRQAA